MRRWLILLYGLSAAAVTAAPAYMWVDESGQVHYSDRPVPGARRIDLPESQPRPQAARAPAATASQPESAQPAEPPTRYRTFDVIRPGQQETLWNIGGTLDVELALTPGLQPGHRLGVYLDGELRELSTRSLQFTVPEVWRGVHTLQGVVFDQNGEEVLRTMSVTFMVQQTSILNPNNPTPPAQRNNTPAG